MNIISLQNIVKHYPGASKSALKGITLNIRAGDSVGLMGPNGAGKTTLISIICGLLKPDSGIVKILGGKASAMVSKLGFVPQEIALYPSLTAYENLFYFGTLYGIKKNKLKEKIGYWLKRLALDTHSEKRVEMYSGGMKRRLNLIAALLHEPELLILDEPTVGIDIHSKMIILDELQALNNQGVTLVYTSHQFEEAEKICRSIVIIDQGEIKWSGSAADLKNQQSNSLQELFIEITGIEYKS
jgi:ABC-2 type transport system ATP-binding protein